LLRIQMRIEQMISLNHCVLWNKSLLRNYKNWACLELMTTFSKLF
jgi:hypothetical protein